MLSFVYVGTYWNHHHLLQAARSIDGRVLWANLHLLTCGLGDDGLPRQLVAHHGKDSHFASGLGREVNDKLSLLAYVIGILAAWLLAPWLGFAVFVGVALMWLVPDRRMAAVAATHTRR